MDDMCNVIEYYERKTRLKNGKLAVLMTNLLKDKAMELLKYNA